VYCIAANFVAKIGQTLLYTTQQQVCGKNRANLTVYGTTANVQQEQSKFYHARYNSKLMARADNRVCIS